MPNRDPRVDAYIAKSAPFAQPILTHIRTLVHKACPDVTETMKWSMPFFEHHGVVANMAAFKAHCAFGFWHAAMRPTASEDDKAAQAMGQFGRIASVKDLPSNRELLALIKKAAQLNEQGVGATPKPKHAKPALAMPDVLMAALKKNKKAASTFEAFSPSNKREYIEWIIDAKTDATRDKRVAQAIEWMAEGKPRNWKYMKC